MVPERGASVWLLGGPLALLLALFAASAAAWLILGLPVASYDPLQMPNFFWYYRGDPDVVRAFAGGAVAGSATLIGLAYVIMARRPPLHGDARFANEREVRLAGFRSREGIVVGRKSALFLVFGGPEHVIVEAPTRSGKGVGIVIPNLLTWQGSIVVLDVKRENYDASAGFRARHGQDIFLFNPSDRDGRTARYNPLAHIDRADPDDVIIELQKVATMLFTAPSHGEAFWANGARIGFIGAGAYIAEATGRPLTFGEIYRLLTTGDVRAFFKQELADRSLILSSGCRTALTDFVNGSDNVFADIMKTVTNVLGLWLNPLVDAATAASDFDFRALRRKPMSIYLGVSPDELDRVAPLYNLVLQQLVDLNVRTLPSDEENIPVLVILDEFARLGRASVLASAFSYVAGYGIRLLPVIQSRSQLRGVYGEHVADEIVANCGVEVAFTPKDARVAAELSERLGYRGQDSVTRSLTIDGLLANRSKSVSEQRRALLLPQELLQFPSDRLMLLRGGVPPIVARKIVSYRSRFFRGRQRPAPLVPVMAGLSPRRHGGAGDSVPTGEVEAVPSDFDDAAYPSFFADVATACAGEAVIGTIEEGEEYA